MCDVKTPAHFVGVFYLVEKWKDGALQLQLRKIARNLVTGFVTTVEMVKYVVRILFNHGFTSKLSLHHLDLESSDAKSLVENLNYGQKCFVQGLVKLCGTQNDDSKPNPYALGINDEFTPDPPYPRKRKKSGSAVVSGKGKGSASRPAKKEG